MSWKYEITDNNFQHMKRWLEECGKNWGWDAPITIRNVYRMVQKLEQMQEAIDDSIINALNISPIDKTSLKRNTEQFNHPSQ